MLNIAVFASGRGSNFEALHRAIVEQKFSAQVVVVISNNSTSGVLSLAQSFGIPALHLSQRQFPDPKAYQQAVVNALKNYNVNFIVLAGYMKKLDTEIIRTFPKRIINIHPALLPKFGGEGMYGMFVHTAVIAASEQESGATVHFVDEEYDRGAIIAQQKISISSSDTPESLAVKVLAVEHTLLPSVVKTFSQQLST
ncbi:MAG: phosphoribosylglycinamide formyltransferase [Bacteriovoracaceae bacterium]|nr:phosphoribosylglycinamide formyltransferase [Bacteroidota bacterium]